MYRTSRLSLGFLLVIPLLVFDAAFASRLPAACRRRTRLAQWNDVPALVALPEGVLRVGTMLLTLLLPISAAGPGQRFGAVLYAAGLVAYVTAWTVQIRWPGSAWSAGAAGFLAPAVTPALWLTGYSRFSGVVKGFVGAVPHAHDQFDEGIYVLRGRLLVAGAGEPEEAAAGSMFTAPPRVPARLLSNPFPEEALVLGFWAPSELALAFMREIGTALRPDLPPDPDSVREIYARHASRLLP